MLPITDVVVNSAAQDKTAMVVAVEVEVKDIDKAILLNSDDGGRRSTVSFAVRLAIRAGKPSGVVLDIVVACQICRRIKVVQRLKRDRCRYILEVVFNRHVLDMSSNVGRKPSFTALEISVGCIGQSIRRDSGALQEVASGCCKSGCDRYQSECDRSEGQGHDCCTP